MEYAFYIYTSFGIVILLLVVEFICLLLNRRRLKMKIKRYFNHLDRLMKIKKKG